MKNRPLGFVLGLIGASALLAGEDRPLLLQSPTLSEKEIAFAYGDYIWIVPREGGDARRLVAGGGINAGPIFSPDGTMVAFTGNIDGNADVYVVPASGGQLRRLTYHPAPDVALGWTPDGKSILFRSSRESYSRFERLFIVPLAGGLPSALPLPMGVQGSYSADSSHVAYVPFWNRVPGSTDRYIANKGYRGGKASPIWIADMSDSAVTPLPRDGSNDFNPMWLGDEIFFLSDRNGAVTLFSYDTKSKKVRERVKNDGFELKSAGAGPGGIVYEQFGSLHLFDLATGISREIHVRVAGDMPQVRPRFEKIDPEQIVNAGISPTGARALFEAYGEIFTVPAKNGDVRNITHSPAVADRDPAWSPDGRSIAYFSDESGEYSLHISDQSGLGKARVIGLGDPPSFFYRPTWSPDGKKIAYNDKRLNLWYVELDHPKPIKVDTDRFQTPAYEFDVVWSPDSQWLAYTKQLKNRLHAIFAYSLEITKATQLTDGMSDALFPKFDRNGKLLYFTASTDVGLNAAWLDTSSNGHQITRTAYVAVLRKGLPSPLAPESDEENDAKTAEARPNVPDVSQSGVVGKANTQAETPADQTSNDRDEAPPRVAKGKDEPAKVAIDFEAIGQRTLALPIPAGDIVDLWAGESGVLYVVSRDRTAGLFSVQRFDLKTRRTETILDGVNRFALSADGRKMLYERKARFFIVGSDKAPNPSDGALKFDSMEVYVDPPAEWRQLYHEAWRIERDFFYDPNYHGLDLAAAEKAYEPFLDGIASRADLNYLFGEMLGNLNVSHLGARGGIHPHVDPIRVGLLGADYTIDHGRYRFARIFDGENWNPALHALLTRPGVDVKAGEYLLAVNGRPLQAADNIYSFFLETAGKQVVLRVGPNPDGTDSREVTVIPVESEDSLRTYAWIEDNRRKVDELSGGRLAYVYLPDTARGGFTNFNRYYFAQVGKEGAVIDERFNSGGQLADYIIDYLRRPILSKIATREGEDQSEPVESIYGPKAMITNEFAGSGGDALPWYFRKAKIGPLIGTRTWGGLVGAGGYPQLIDGGYVNAPCWAVYGLEGQWEIENQGISPDIEVAFDPKLVREGHDPQLEKAVEVLLELLKQHPVPTYAKPKSPDFHPHLPQTP